MSHEDWSSKSFWFRFSSKKQKIYRIHSSTLVYICIICTISSHSSPPKKLQFLPYFPIQETCELLQSQIPKERCWTQNAPPKMLTFHRRTKTNLCWLLLTGKWSGWKTVWGWHHFCAVYMFLTQRRFLCVLPRDSIVLPFSGSSVFV